MLKLIFLPLILLADLAVVHCDLPDVVMSGIIYVNLLAIILLPFFLTLLPKPSEKLPAKFGKFSLPLIAFSVSLLIGCLVSLLVLPSWYSDFSKIAIFCICAIILFLILFVIAILFYNETQAKNGRNLLNIATITISSILMIAVFFTYASFFID